ncbi:glycosyltransferase family 4 protein [Ancylobacter oerskovii]|uniref:Glycosyltransferase family 4 protein n=1 Tax=Ancylobacter oerskovii TaxID=459519 RepID=A0ABW4YYK6_9HYPH|nr:glycosyltransferase family 4 protein [Ancylobacter oerskovii]MBS7541758.1 glycosyltransferase family 4 protein [Ancylobacter oerskovii]
MARGGSESRLDPGAFPEPTTVEAVAPNLKRRLSGVTSTLERVVPVQARSLRIAALGPKLAAGVPRISWTDLRHFWRPPPGRPARIWHARRNIEMLTGLILRDLLRMKLRLVFTSASQRHHTGWTRFLISRMDAVISTSAKTATYLRRPSTVIHHGIDADMFRPPESRASARAALGLPDLTLIGCFGRIRAQKGTDVFVEALIRLLPDHPGWGGVVLGRALAKDAGFLDDLKAKVAAAGLQDRLLFPSEVETSATPDWYRALDLYVAPQRWEGFGVTPIEAMACGVPVIATRVGAFEELVKEGVTGALVPPGDIEAMTAALRAHLALDDDARAAMAARARAHAVSTFSLEREAAKINAVYEAVWDVARRG